MNTSQITSTNTLHRLFEIQADLNSTRSALKCGSVELSYKELDCRSNQLAQYLYSNGIGRGCLVGIFMKRSHRPIITLLGILKSGAGYVPIDPEFPPERIRHIVNDTQLSAIITDNSLYNSISELYLGKIFNWDQEYQQVCSQSPERLFHVNANCQANDVCYIIYTSGTTGCPKGVITRHRNVLNFLESFNEVCRLSMHDRVYQGFSLGFDGSVEEIWMAFSNGATLIVGTTDIVKIGSEVSNLINRERITFFSTVPTFLAMINEPLPSVRLLIVSGEPCTQYLVDKWASGERRMLNVYGPTETTVNTTVAECKPGKTVTIGRPLSGYDLYLLNECMEPVPRGQEGELYIGGIGVAGGYLNKREMSEKHFIRNPFNGHDNTSRLYRTGDIVKWNVDGELVFLGRLDSQVKIRGYRIELAEIESVLQECDEIASAAVILNTHHGRKDLAAFIVQSNGEKPLRRDVILNRMRVKLPAYMIPAYLDTVNDIPRLASGKVDRAHLPSPSTPLVAQRQTIIAPSTELEKTILSAWEKVFSMDTISIDNDFFIDLGGYSLMAAEVVSNLRNKAGLTVTIRDVYDHPTIKQLAAHVKSGKISMNHNSHKNTIPVSQLNRDLFNRVSRFTRWCCIGFQAISLYVIYGLSTIPIFISFVLYLGLQNGTISLSRIAIFSAGLFLGLYPAMLVIRVFHCNIDE